MKKDLRYDEFTSFLFWIEKKWVDVVELDSGDGNDDAWLIRRSGDKEKRQRTVLQHHLHPRCKLLMVRNGSGEVVAKYPSMKAFRDVVGAHHVDSLQKTGSIFKQWKVEVCDAKTYSEQEVEPDHQKAFETCLKGSQVFSSGQPE